MKSPGSPEAEPIIHVLALLQEEVDKFVTEKLSLKDEKATLQNENLSLQDENSSLQREKLSLEDEVRELKNCLASGEQDEAVVGTRPVQGNTTNTATGSRASQLTGISDDTTNQYMRQSAVSNIHQSAFTFGSVRPSSRQSSRQSGISRASGLSQLSNLVGKHPTIVECYLRRNFWRPGGETRGWGKGSSVIWKKNLNAELEAEDIHWFKRLLLSPLFDMLVGAMIVANTLCMAGEMQYQGRVTGFELQFREYETTPPQAWTTANDVFKVLDKVFIILFALELSLRFMAFRCEVFKEPLNWIDIVAVGAGVLHWFIAVEYAMDNMMLRFLRIAKLLFRTLRLLKLTKFVESLHILTKSITASISTLFWSIVLLIMFQFVAGMMISQLVSHILLDDNVDHNEREIIFSYYGSFLRSQLTMFEIHLANFGPPCRILVDHCGEWYGVIFIAYRCLAGFAVLNVINAVFIQQTIALASKDSEILFMNRHREVLHYTRDLKRLFKELDSDADGELDFKEWRVVKANPKFVHIMNALEINAADTTSLFELLDLNGDGVISVEEFVEAALCLKGNARSVDVLAVLGHLHKLRQEMNALDAHLGVNKPASGRKPGANATRATGETDESIPKGRIVLSGSQSSVSKASLEMYPATDADASTNDFVLEAPTIFEDVNFRERSISPGYPTTEI